MWRNCSKVQEFCNKWVSTDNEKANIPRDLLLKKKNPKASNLSSLIALETTAFSDHL